MDQQMWLSQILDNLSQFDFQQKKTILYHSILVHQIFKDTEKRLGKNWSSIISFGCYVSCWIPFFYEFESGNCDWLEILIKTDFNKILFSMKTAFILQRNYFVLSSKIFPKCL